MSGHSKWSQIKRQKQAGDAKRGLAFSKLAKAISLAVQQAGGNTNPGQNFKLRLAIERAKAANMPKDNIDRAIERGKGQGQVDIEEILYEGFGPRGSALVIEAATDNRLRTAQGIKNTLELAGGTLGGPGSCVFLFERVGVLAVAMGKKSLDEILDLIVRLGARDVEEQSGEDGLITVYTDPDKLHAVEAGLTEAGISVIEAQLIYLPKTPILLGEPIEPKKLRALIDSLEDNPDVQKVYTNVVI